MSDCKTCDDILRCFTDPPSPSHRVNLGSLDEALSSPCQRHMPLVVAWRDYMDMRMSKGFVEDQNLSHDVGMASPLPARTPTFYESITKLGHFWSLLLEARHATSDHTRKGRILHPDWVDLDVVRRWKQECLSSHDSTCVNPINIPITSPAWLVDVENGCVVPGAGIDRYVALSYRWGSASGFKLDESNLEALQQHNALNSPQYSHRLAPTIKHAMSLTPLIGERYIWIDALCIVHGGSAATIEQLNLMGAIYASALLTIVAADGDSSDGLLGLQDISASRELEQRVIPFGDEKILVRNTHLFSMGGGTKYYERAWTYQEFKMSPRKLLFNRKEVHWECQCSQWHEELTLGTELDKYIDPRLGVLVSGFPDLTSLSHMISSYNERELTYDEDALSGLAGLLAVLSRTFQGGFLYGCPEMFFECALGWVPQWNHTNLRRRISSDRPLVERVASTALPSWSWTGWSGIITFRHGEAIRINDRCSNENETIPITEWYTSSAPSGQPRRRIRSSWYENRAKYKAWGADPNKQLPDGWTRHEAAVQGIFRDEPRIYPDGCGGQVFKHDKLSDPDKGNQEWWYPFPIPDVSTSTPFFTPAQTPYLFCRTKKASVWAERVDYEKWPDGHKNIKLRDAPGGLVIGRLHLQTDEQLRSWPDVKVESPNAEGQSVDLVAISRNVMYSKTWNEELQRCDGLKREQRYTVLWVEWKDQVAYRLACGYVDQSAWEALQLKDIDLVLG